MEQLYTSTPELKMVMMILDKLDIPESINQIFDYQGTSHDINIRRIGLNPAMALNVLRTYGIEGVKHSAPTLYFWNADGATKDICDAFKAEKGEMIFDLVQDVMLSRTATIQ